MNHTITYWMRAMAAVALLATSTRALAQSDREHMILEPSAARNALPFSDAVRVGNTLYLSGQIGADEKTNAIPADPKEETRLLMDGIQQVVQAAGMTMDDLVQVHVLCTDLKLFNDFNSVYRTYFHHGFPSRTFTGSTQLLLGAHFEVTGIAVKTKT
jgi:2-iminobutanoate/2-iminopropanoate deaminase